MQYWEYRTETLKTTGFLGGSVNTESMDELLNRLGSEGWELVNAFDTSSFAQGASQLIVLVFKRPRG